MEWIIIKEKYKEHSWYTNKPLKVLEKKIVDNKVILYLDYNFAEYLDFYSNEIAEELINYYPMRENKLKRILEEIDVK